MRKFGELIGMAFQIKDDLFDYGNEAIGKPTGIDIKEQKMTLPLIHVLNKVNKEDKKWLINSIKNHNRDKKRVKQVITFVKDEGGLDFAINKMNAFKDEALTILSFYPESEFKTALVLMVNYVIDQKKINFIPPGNPFSLIHVYINRTQHLTYFESNFNFKNQYSWLTCRLQRQSATSFVQSLRSKMLAVCRS